MNLFGVIIALGLYATTFVVTDVEITTATETTPETVVLICEDYNGNQLKIPTDDGDWFAGDILTAIMDSKGTESIYDDEVICARYAGTIEGWVVTELEAIEHMYE